MSRNEEAYRLSELASRIEKNKQTGGEKKIDKQHGKSRLTVRERIDLLFDRGTFDETGILCHSDLPEAVPKTPADGKVCGFGQIEGRTVYVSGDDVTVMSGAGGRIGVIKAIKNFIYAAKKGFPCIHLGDGGGARIPDTMGAMGIMKAMELFDAHTREVPFIVNIMGECYGGPTWEASISDVVIQVKGSVMAVTSPRIIEVATGETSTAEELGGWELHGRGTGQVDLFAGNHEDNLWLCRRLLSYLPSNAHELPPQRQCSDPSDVKIESIFEAVPEDPKQLYDIHNLLNMVFDRDSVLELKPYYDGSLVTCLARLAGQVVGVFANNPLVTAGAMGPGACEKAIAFICLCDSFNIPMIFIHDTPGFLVGRAAEEKKMPLKIMSMIKALQLRSVPCFSLIVRKSYGMAHHNMAGGKLPDAILAWPIADISFMAPDVAINAAFGQNPSENPEVEKMREAFMQEMMKKSEPWEAAGMNLIDKIIDPRDTRTELVKALDRARGSSGTGGMSRRLLASWPRMV